MTKIKLFTIPNAITLLGLLSGSLATFLALRGDLQFAFGAICLAAVFDFLDGFVARLTGSYSALGKELDSLADIISFGFAPAAILLELIQNIGGGYWGLASFLLTAFSALRLAKFNVDERQTSGFRGLPTPAVGILIGALGSLFVSGTWSAWPLWAMLGLEGVLCALLVSDIPMFSLKKPSVSLYAFLAAGALVLVLLRIEGIPYIIGGYVVWSLVVAKKS